MLEHNSAFQSLNDQLQAIAQDIANGVTSVERLVKHLNEQTKSHVTHEHLVTRSRIDVLNERLENRMDAQFKQAEFDKFLQSLHFPEIDLRQETITSAHGKTFEWIFDGRQDLHVSWDSFTDWLQNDEQLYWILGKPGSGKSTLMSFIVQHERTGVLLESNGQQTTLLTFFFWENGADLQKNQLGLLRSLAYQILNSMPPKQKLQAWSVVIRPNITALPTAWTCGRLLQLLTTLLRTVHRRFCLFLDGLDEFKGQPDTVGPIAALLDVFGGHGQFKICISSRPEPELESLHKTCSGLTMQELTETDIREYVKDKLLNCPPIRNLDPATLLKSQDLVYEVVKRAEGVFLWVKLAVQSLLRGVRNGDSWDDMQQRLMVLPSGIFELYTHMWGRKAEDQPVYAKEAALFLQLIQLYGGTSLVELAIFADDHLQAMFSGSVSTWSASHLLAEVRFDRYRDRVATSCAGYLEILEVVLDDWQKQQENGYRAMLEESTVEFQPEAIVQLVARYRSYNTKGVNFVHRTVAEYLRTSAGREILRACRYSNEEVAVRYERSSLIKFFLVQPPPGGMKLENRFQCFRTYPLLPADNTIFDLEIVCNQILMWKLLRLTENQSKCYRGCDNDIDYTKLFISFSSVDYTRTRLASTGLSKNRAYLTDLLGCWAWWSDNLWTWRSAEVPSGNAVLLLELGANPNHRFCTRYGSTDITIWQSVLLCAARSRPKKLSSDFMQALIQNRADLNSIFTFIHTRESSSSWWSWREADMADAFVVFGCSPWDLVMASPGVKDDVKALLDRAGATSRCKTALWFETPGSWRVLSDPKSMTKLISHAMDMYVDDVHPETFSEDFGEMLEHLFTEDCCEIFHNGRHAFRAAGWSNEEIREEPWLKRIWDDLNSSTDSQDTNFQEVSSQEDDDEEEWEDVDDEDHDNDPDVND